MRKTKLKTKLQLIIGIGITSGILLFIIGFIFSWSLRAIGKDEDVQFRVRAGDSKYQVVTKLQEANLIRIKLPVYFYLMVTPKHNFKAGVYRLNRKLNAFEIIAKFDQGAIDSESQIVKITFVEGKRLIDYYPLLKQKLGINPDQITALLKDEKYLNELKKRYWIITDDVTNPQIYYSLEGYLFPSTYEFYHQAPPGVVIEKLLTKMEAILEPYRLEMNKRQLSVHEVLTMASIIEKEANSPTDRQKVSQVIYKRLKLGMALGMDVTAYYGVQKKIGDLLSEVDFKSQNPYNTRNTDFKGLPVGPICNPSRVSIDAVFNPSATDYTYFLADIATGNIYFMKEYNEFLRIKKELGG